MVVRLYVLQDHDWEDLVVFQTQNIHRKPHIHPNASSRHCKGRIHCLVKKCATYVDNVRETDGPHKNIWGKPHTDVLFHANPKHASLSPQRRTIFSIYWNLNPIHKHSSLCPADWGYIGLSESQSDHVWCKYGNVRPRKMHPNSWFSKRCCLLQNFNSTNSWNKRVKRSIRYDLSYYLKVSWGFLQWWNRVNKR